MSASPRALFDFLSDLERHWMLADRFVEVLTLDQPDGGGRAAGGTVRVRGPLGLSRTARTRVTEAHQDELIWGTAEVGPRTRARVTWRFARQSDETLVELSAV